MIAREGYDPIDYDLISTLMSNLTSFEEWLDAEGVKKIKELQAAAK
jgi:hypothetical protein